MTRCHSADRNQSASVNSINYEENAYDYVLVLCLQLLLSDASCQRRHLVPAHESQEMPDENQEDLPLPVEIAHSVLFPLKIQHHTVFRFYQHLI